MTTIPGIARYAGRPCAVLLALALPLLPALGCHSAFVQATVSNQTGGSVHLFEVDYPNASFGSEELATGKDFRYRFKILGDGPTKLTWTDAAQHDHTANGPTLVEGQEGDLRITLLPGGKASWVPLLHKP